jgi:hypothetical protein
VTLAIGNDGSEPRPYARLRGDNDGNLLRAHGDDGYALAMIGLMVIPLMVFVAFAVDLGAWFAQGSKVQRSADAAALAGVVWLPIAANASAAATSVATANGYTNGTAGAVVTPSVASSTQYQVSITSPAPRFFSQVFGTKAFTITRTAIAEFNKPIPLGSPTNQFGNDVSACAQFQPCPGQPMLWSAINGPYDPFANGDPYATKCAQNGASGSAANCETAGVAKNTLYRPTGYNYAIDIAAADVGKDMTVQVWDAGVQTRVLTPNNTTVPESAAIQATRDCDRGVAPFIGAPYYGSTAPTSKNWAAGFTAQNCQTGDNGAGQNMDFQLFDNDKTDLTVLYDTPLTSCHLRMTDNDAVTFPGTYINNWATICTFKPTLAGVYPLRVRNSSLTSPTETDVGDGTNGYALKVTGGTTTRLYALDDMSIWTNTPASAAQFYLAEIAPEHAGKKIQIDLYDPGDGNASTTDYTLQVLGPKAGAPSVVPTAGTVIPSAGVTSCVYNSTVSATKGPATPTTAPSCTVTTKLASAGSGIYNNGWLRIEIQLAANYTCTVSATSDCWWSVKYAFGSGGFPTDRTTWSLNVIGDPVHLVK